MATLPLISNAHGDFVLKLFTVDTENTMAEVAEAAAQNTVGVHVVEQPSKTLRVRLQGDENPFPSDTKVSDSGLVPMDCIEIYYE